MARRKPPVIPDALLDQLLVGADAKSAFDPNGLLDGLKKALSERALNAEMDHHLSSEAEVGNSRNGYGRKTVLTGTGSLELEIPRDRRASFDPQLSALGHADRAVPFRAYCTGLILPGDRKSVEPMAARVEPGRVGAAHQSLHHFVAKAAWDDAAVLAGVRDLVLPALLERGPIRAWIIDDTGMPKKGRHSVGGARQHCGQIDKQDNCQVAVSLSLATDHASLPVAFRLYLPEAWAGDAERRTRTGVPDGVCFQTKPAIALDQIRTAMTAGLPPGVVLMDAGYGNDTALRDGVIPEPEISDSLWLWVALSGQW